MKTIVSTLLFLTACLLAASAARTDETDEARHIAREMIKADTIRFLTDREFEIEGEVVEGEVQAVDPEEHVKVEIKELLLLPDHASVTSKIEARFEFAGTLIADGKKINVKATATLSPEIHFEADYDFEDGELEVDARITDAKFKAEVLELDPDDLPGGKQAAEKLIEQEIERTKTELVRELNDWIKEHYSR